MDTFLPFPIYTEIYNFLLRKGITILSCAINTVSIIHNVFKNTLTANRLEYYLE
jgi:hypothetical protein